MRLDEIKARKLELREQVQNLSGEALDNAIAEIENLDKEERAIKSDSEKRAKLNSLIGSGFSAGNAIEVQDGQKPQNYGADSAEYRSAFFKTIAGVELNDVEKRAMTTNSNSAGAAVPTTTLNKIYEKIENDAVVYGLVTVSHLKGNVVIPIENVTNDVQRKAEGQEGTIQNDSLTSITLGAKKYIKLIQLTFELEATAIDALEAYVVNRLSKKMAQAIDYDIINGAGVTGATGILTTITPSATVGSAWTYDDVCDLFAGINATARKSATLLMSTNTLFKQIKKIKDDEKRPIFDPAQNKVLGREVVECDDVPDGTVIFGDFSEYMFNWNKDAVIDKSSEVGFKSGDSVFRIIALCDGALADLGAITAKAAPASGSTGTGTGTGS